MNQEQPYTIALIGYTTTIQIIQIFTKVFL